MVYSENDLMCKYVPVLLTGYETLGNQPLVADYTFKMALHSPVNAFSQFFLIVISSTAGISSHKINVSILFFVTDSSPSSIEGLPSSVFHIIFEIPRT